MGAIFDPLGPSYTQTGVELVGYYLTLDIRLQMHQNIQWIRIIVCWLKICPAHLSHNMWIFLLNRCHFCRSTKR